MRRSSCGMVSVAFLGAIVSIGCGSSASSHGTATGTGSSGGTAAAAGSSSGGPPPMGAPVPMASGGAGTPSGSGGGASAGGTPSGAGGQPSAGASSADAGAAGAVKSAGPDAGTGIAGQDASAAPMAAGEGGAADPGTEGDGDYTISPPYMTGRVAVTNVPHSSQYQFTMQSSASQVYPGNWTRVITVYIPKQYVDGAAAPFIVVQDGNAPATGLPEIVTAGENLYGDPSPTNRIPPLVWVFVPPGGNERSQEYDTVSDAYSRFINGEVLPLVESNASIKAAYPNFKLTTDPDGRAAYGCSSGAPAAMGMAWFADYHRVVSYSGSFVSLQTNAAHPLGAWEYPSMILATPAKPLRIFLEVGEDDNGYTATADSHMNWVIANQNMAAALKMQGYHYRFLFAKTATHCDGSVKSQTYEETLSWLWRGYPTN